MATFSTVIMTILPLVGDTEVMKGDISDVSLQRESGQILEVEDVLDFGDCYSGLIAVS